MWKQTNWRRWTRSDGAAVLWDQRSPYPNPVNPASLMWTAWEPDPSERPLMRFSKRGHGYARRWKTAEAAMREVDRLHPSRTAGTNRAKEA